MSKNKKLLIILLLSLASIVLAVCFGSTRVTVGSTVDILLFKLLGIKPTVDINPITESIVWQLRLPRVLLAFLVGGCLAVGGVVMQSALRNPLASSYTLGVSTGAAMGVSLCIILNISVLGVLTLPVFGLTFGLATVFLAIGVAARLDRNLESTTIILTGMAFSLFSNAIITLFMSLARQELQRIIFWQLGSFALKEWWQPAVLLPFFVIGLLIIVRYSTELDMMTFGEEQARAAGVSLKRVKWILLSVSAIISGCCVALVGAIGFVDLFTPHIARRIFGAGHRLVVPASALLGGLFMVLCDLVARSIAPPIELPVGAVTALIGSPFFIYVFFNNRNRG